ncbi:MAG: hypothetical protein GY866_09420 [Proteobacteria bacterium]|nr:hypothetical protein [Pseudomonadota bacterium]
MGRYTHRTAISNNGLISMDGGRVRFGYRDCKQDYAPRVCEQSVEQFIGRFLLHELPGGFMGSVISDFWQRRTAWDRCAQNPTKRRIFEQRRTRIQNIQWRNRPF